MVKKLLSLFNTEIASVHNAAFLLGGFALLSQMIALFRDRILASTFGAGIELDIYYAAFKIPDLLFVTIASLVSVSVIVPFIVKSESISKKEVQSFVNNIFTFFFLLIFVVAGILYVYMPQLSAVFFPGFSPAEISQLVDLSRIMLLSPMLLGLSNIFGSITQAYNKFVLYALSPVLYNIGIVIGVVFFTETHGLAGLAWGVALGALLHMLIQVPGVIAQGLMPRFVGSLKLSTIKEVLALSLPRTFTLATNQITLITFAAFATFMSAGSVAIFNLSLNLQSVPLSIIGVSYSLAAFPTLSRLYHGKKHEEYMSHITVALRHIIFWSVPISIYFIVLRAQIIRVILGSGNFSWEDTRLVAASLAMFSVSVFAQGAILLFVRGFYAAGRTKLPLISNTIAMIISITSGYGFFTLYKESVLFSSFLNDLLRISDIAGGEVIVLALAFTLGTIVNLLLLWWVFEKKIGSVFGRVHDTVIHSIGAGILGGAISYLMLNILSPLLDTETLVGIFSQGFIAGIVGIAANILFLKLLRNKEAEEILGTLKRKIWPTSVIVDDKVV
jgi:putative peptidoglycan lipid II flippase